MVEQNVKGGNVREVSLGSNEATRPANKGRNVLSREEPLVGADQEEGRAARRNPRVGSLVGAAVLSIGVAFSSMACEDNGSKHEEDAGTDAGECPEPDGGLDTDSLFALCGEPGSETADNEGLLSVGKKEVFTKSGRNIEVVGIYGNTAVVRLAEEEGEPLANGEDGYDELSSEEPLLTVGGDGETQTMVLCGFEEDSEGLPAARIATDRENGFIHCEDINSGSDSVPVEHDIDDTTVEVLVTNMHSGGQLAVDGDVEDCDPQTDEIKKQRITFQDGLGAPMSLTSRNVLLHSEAQTLKVHKLVEGLLVTFEVDLYEVDGVAGTAKIGSSKLGTGILGVGDSFVAADQLRVSLNNFVGAVPDFSYSYEPDTGAEVWVTITDNPNEVEVNVVSEETTKTFVVRFSNDKGDGKVDVTVIDKSAFSVLGNGGEANLDGKIYTSTTETDAAGIAKIWLTPAE